MRRRRLFLPAALLAAVLAAAIALSLWYTRPRSWDALVGNAEAAALTALYSEATLTVTTGGGSTVDISTYRTDGALAPDTPGGAALLSVLEDGRYRAALLNLAGPRDQLGQDTGGSVQLSLMLDDGTALSLTFGDAGQLTVGREDGLCAYTADCGQYEALAALIRVHGQPVSEDGAPAS